MSDLITGIEVASFDQAMSAVLVHIDFGAAQAISCVDLTDVEISGAAIADVLAVQYSEDDAAWTTLAAATFGGGVRSRRFAAEPGAAISAQYWRAIVADPAGCHGRSIDIASVRFLAETDTLSAARCAPHYSATGASYVHVFSDLASDIYADGVRAGAAALPYPSGVLGNLDFTHDIDLMLVFHASTPPHRLFRQGAADEWDSRTQDFENIPNYAFPGETYVNGVDEVQQITFDGYANGETFNITFDGETTSTIVYSSVMATTASRIKSALEALDAMGGGTVTVTNTSGTIFSITFGGAAGAWDWPEIFASVVLSTSGTVSTATLTEGEEGGEPVASAARGWWVTGDFDQERLILAGPAGAPKIINASPIADLFNLRAAGRRATDGVMLSITSGNIRQIASENFLQIFTEEKCLSLRQAALLGDDDNPIKPDADHGVQDRMRPVSVDGATMIVAAGGRSIVELRWSEEAQRHTADVVSVRAPELVLQPIDIFARRAGFGFQNDVLLVALNAGGISAYHSLREFKFRAWTRYTTPAGKFLAGGEQHGGPTVVVTEREINGETVRYVEGFDYNRLLDCSIRVTIGAASPTLTAAHLAGCENVWAIGDDGFWHGPMTADAAGVITSAGEDFPATTYEIGLFFDAWFDPMPFNFDTASGNSIRDNPKHVAEVVVSLLNSAPPELVYMSKTRRFADAAFAAGVTDAPPMQNLSSGRLSIDRLRGWSHDPPTRIRRKWPGPLNVRSCVFTINWTP